MSAARIDDVLVIGGGIVGLSLAYELAGRGLSARLIDSSVPGREASWAGAGILPPAPAASSNPLEQLTAQSNALHVAWSVMLREETGLDNGLRRCGGLYLSCHPGEADHLRTAAARWRQDGIQVKSLSAEDLAHLEPDVQPAAALEAAFLLPDESQIRNPWHLKALLAACQRRGVEIVAGVAAEEFDVAGARLNCVRTNQGALQAGSVCIASGAWSGAMAARLGGPPAIKPVRGQIALLCAEPPAITRILNDGPRYLVPRSDGRLLVGSTEEDVGFDRRVTQAGIGGLLEFALSWIPRLGQATFERCWAGLRPGTPDGLPYLGRLPGLENAFIAAGHFRSGLQLSTGTAVVMGRLICGEDPQLDLKPFRLDRPVGDASEAARRR